MTQNEIRVGIVGADTKASWAKVSPSSTRPNSDRKERGYLPRVRQSESALDLVAGDLMSSPAVVAADTLSVREVARLMLEHGVGGVPVIDASGAAIGMVSDGDLMGRRSDVSRWDSWWLRMLADGASSQEIFGRGGDRPVREVMSAPLIAVSPGAPV